MTRLDPSWWDVLIVWPALVAVVVVFGVAAWVEWRDGRRR